MSGRKQARSEPALRKRFQAEEQQAIDAVARWVGHPAVRGVIERRRIGAETVVMPIGRMLTGQVQVIRFCWHVFGLAGIEPGWELRNGEPWMLTISEMNTIDRVEADLRAVVQMAVKELAAAGVGLVPSWTGDHVVVAELLLLDVTWDLPARELAEALQPPAIGAIQIDASGTTHRRGTGERANNNIAALRRGYERHLYGAPPRAPLRQRRYACPARAHPATAAGTGQGHRALARRHGLTHPHDVRGLRTAARRPGQEPRRLPASAAARSRRTRRDRALPLEKHPPRGLESPPARHARSESVRLNDPASFSRTARFALCSGKQQLAALGPGRRSPETTERGQQTWP